MKPVRNRLEPPLWAAVWPGHYSTGLPAFFYLESRTSPVGQASGEAAEGAKEAAVDRLRIGLFTEIYRPVVNGVVASIEALAQGLESRGHETFCFAPHMPGQVEADGPVFRMPSLPLPTKTPYRLTLPLVARRNVNAVIKTLSIVHAHSPFVTGWTALRYARRYRIPMVYTYHTQLEEYAHYVPFEQNATRYAASQLTRTFANLADAVVVPTESMARRLRDLGVRTRVDVVPSAIDVDRFAAGRRNEAVRAAAGAGPNDRLLLCVSRLGREKNVEVLLEAMAAAGDPGLRLAVAGDGPDRERLELRAAELGVTERTRFMGVQPRERLPDLYAGCDAFCMPSTTETQGLVLVEALAAGAALIVSDVPQSRDVLLDSATFVTPTAAGFASAMRDVPGDPTATEHRRDARLAERFRIDRHVDRMVELYRDLQICDRIA
jgi:1,2-diacylglycerol 3-alpha-glucosyltransferase